MHIKGHSYFQNLKLKFNSDGGIKQIAKQDAVIVFKRVIFYLGQTAILMHYITD